MKDIQLAKKCKKCISNITLMTSCRMSEDGNEGEFLVERCLICGQHPVIEVARLHEDQTGLEQLETPIVNLNVKEKK